MKQIIIAALIVALGVVGFVVVKNRFGSNAHQNSATSGQIILMNDSADTISVEYKVADKNVDAVLAAGQDVACGSNGLVRVFTAQKSGSYELTYPVDGSARRVSLSQITAAAKKDSVDNDLYLKTGMVGDIKVMYEDAQQTAD